MLNPPPRYFQQGKPPPTRVHRTAGEIRILHDGSLSTVNGIMDEACVASWTGNREQLETIMNTASEYNPNDRCSYHRVTNYVPLDWYYYGSNDSVNISSPRGFCMAGLTPLEACILGDDENFEKVMCTLVNDSRLAMNVFARAIGACFWNSHQDALRILVRDPRMRSPEALAESLEAMITFGNDRKCSRQECIRILLAHPYVFETFVRDARADTLLITVAQSTLPWQGHVRHPAARPHASGQERQAYWKSHRVFRRAWTEFALVSQLPLPKELQYEVASYLTHCQPKRKPIQRMPNSKRRKRTE